MYKVTDNTIMDVDVFKLHSMCVFLNVLDRGIHTDVYGEGASVFEEKLINRISFQNNLNTK